MAQKARKKSKTKEIIGNLDPKYWVQKSDPLVMMRSVPFSLGELKILDTYISRINAGDSSRCTVIFTKEEYEELMGLTCANPRALEKHTKGMLGKVVELEMPNDEYLQFVLFEQARYRKDEYGKPIIELTCTPTAKDLFFCIGKYHYFKYALENVINLTRKASYLLYVYILTNRYRGKWEIELEELRDNVLDCKGKKTYKEFKEFKKSVLAPAVKEVNEKTDCQFDYEPVKRGRTIAAIAFKYHSKKEQIEQQALAALPEPKADEQMSFDEFDEDIEEQEINYGGELADLLGNASCDDEFSPEQIRVLQDLVLQVVGHDHMQCCDYLSHKVHIMNLYNPKRENRFTYLVKMIKNDIKDPDSAL